MRWEILGRRFRWQKIMGGFQSGQMGQTVNLLSFDFGGSNPSPPTLKRSCFCGFCASLEQRPLLLKTSQNAVLAEIAQLIEH